MSSQLIRPRVVTGTVRSLWNIAAFSRLRQDSPSPWALRSLSSYGGGIMFVANAAPGSTTARGHTDNFFSLKAKDKRHQEVNMSDYANKVVLVVNVASNCGFTSQYKELEQLYKDYKDRGLVIIGFPCNQFGKQEPGTNEEIESFCKLNYGVTFPVMDKIDVNGDNEDPVYSFLKSQKSGIIGLTRIKWNFEKFLIGRDGTVFKRYSSAASPSSIATDIEKLLGPV
ncbi:peroxiredoxin hyr1 [Dissophora ornata]|nr:peroxiredoxin hyr1 [Dissophora ornata]